jgi:hypothetical protein
MTNLNLNNGLLWEEDVDPEHPGFEDNPRFILERHQHVVGHDRLDVYQTITAAAVWVDVSGERIELGPWSLGRHDARILANSLTALVDVLDEVVGSMRVVTAEELGPDPDDGEAV